MTILGAAVAGFVAGVIVTLILIGAAIIYLANHLGYKTVLGFIREIPLRTEGKKRGQ